MEMDLLQDFQDIGYTGPLTNSEKLSQALDIGPKSVEFMELVVWLTDQIATFSDLDERIHPVSSPDDSSSFLLELSAFLKELGCVNQQLMTGNVNQRLATRQSRILLLEYFVTELMASKILEVKKPKITTEMEVTIHESDTAKCLKELLLTLKFQKPPDNITAQLLFEKITTKLNELIKRVPPELLGKPLFIGELSNDQWEKLDNLQHNLNEEYKIRREMLLKRLDVTIQSFLWSERIKAKEEEVNKCYRNKRNALSSEPVVTIADLLAARDDLAVVEKTSNATVRKNTRSQINKIIIGNVPDRGGRPCDQEPPPPEMPSWQKDRAGGSSLARGRGGGGRGSDYHNRKDATKNFGQNYDTPYQQTQYNRGHGNRGGYQSDNRSGGEYYGDGHGKRGRVQGGWNQGNDSAGPSTRQRGGYSRGRNQGGQYR